MGGPLSGVLRFLGLCLRGEWADVGDKGDFLGDRVGGSPDGLTGGSGALCDSSCNGNTSRGRVWCPGRSFGRVLGGVSNRDFRQVLAPLRGVIGGDDVPVAPGASEGDDGAEEWRNTAQWEEGLDKACPDRTPPFGDRLIPAVQTKPSTIQHRWHAITPRRTGR